MTKLSNMFINMVFFRQNMVIFRGKKPKFVWGVLRYCLKILSAL
jgi:hypothetical protein